MSNSKIGVDELVLPVGMIDLRDASALLLSQMKKVSKNPNEIPQGKCMAEIAGRLCDIAKAQVLQAKVAGSIEKMSAGD